MILLLVFAVSLIAAIIRYYQWQLDYWKRRGIPGPPGTIFVGNMHSLTDRAKPIGLVVREWTKVYGKVYGIQEGLRRTLVVSDVEMIKELFMRKFEYFYGRKTNAIVGDVEKDSRVHLFESQGVRWKRLRAISSPAFSSGSLKKIRPTVEDSTLALMELFDERAGQQAFNIFTYYKEFTMDVICRIAMGQKGSKMFTDDKVDRIDKIFGRSFRQPVFYLASIFPGSRLYLRQIFMASSKLRQSSVPGIFKQIYNTIDDRIKKREQTVVGEETQEPTDFIDLFLDARAEQDFDNHAEFTKMGVHVTKQLTREEIAAQCFIFLLAGFDTTANSLAYITYLLAKNPDIQRNLQEEIDQYCDLETISYETLASMKYLDCSVKEGLRMYPTANIFRGIGPSPLQEQEILDPELEHCTGGATELCDWSRNWPTYELFCAAHFPTMLHPSKLLTLSCMR
ncbi:hypothetical protein Y032_0575g199 [Ancylostoma ceylanicum]|uniref:Unspecific monooxygenase n=1 Tax=Ancylostoma ceylanicum TaxID=53326 RepID=A0A016WN70_9BILA|nr:hypothetical protein Y032_0575g199 [Ancylostoma ceylanicum]